MKKAHIIERGRNYIVAQCTGRKYVKKRCEQCWIHKEKVKDDLFLYCNWEGRDLSDSSNRIAQLRREHG